MAGGLAQAFVNLLVAAVPLFGVMPRTLVPVEPGATRLVPAQEVRVDVRAPCDNPVRLDLYLPGDSHGVRLVIPDKDIKGFPLRYSLGWTGFILYPSPGEVATGPSVRRLSGHLTAPPGTTVGMNGERLTVRVLCAGRVDNDALARLFVQRFDPNHPLGLAGPLVVAIVFAAALAAVALLALNLRALDRPIA